MFYPAGDYVARIVQTRVPITAVDNITSVTLTEALPSEIVQSLNANADIYAILGCRKNGTREWVRIENSSYNEATRTIRFRRGQSPFANCSGGTVKDHIAQNQGGLELNFYAIHPCSFKGLVEDVENLKNNITSVIVNNIGNASITQPGLIKTSYFNPSKPLSDSYQAITNEDPFLKAFLSSLLNEATTIPELNFGGTITSQVQNKLNNYKLIASAIFTSPTRTTAFINFLNSLPS